MKENNFEFAKPIWVNNREREKNLICSFKTVFEYERGTCCLRVTGSTVYRILLNGSFLDYGPARAPHGYYRVDEIQISSDRLQQKNILIVEVAGYNTNGYYYLFQPSFLQAELYVNQNVVAFTSANNCDFEPRILSERVQKVQKYSFQRSFVESYQLDGKYETWKNTETKDNKNPIILCETSLKKLLERKVPRPVYHEYPAIQAVASGIVTTFQHQPETPFLDRAVVAKDHYIKSFPKEELTYCLSDEGQSICFEKTSEHISHNIKKIHIPKNHYVNVDFGKNICGFIKATICCKDEMILYLFFDEVLYEGDVACLRMDCCNIIKLELKAGTHVFESFEPYMLRYLKIIAKSQECVVSDISLRSYETGVAIKEAPKFSDKELEIIYNAAVDTFRYNAVDLLMDCPSRERSCWLCDTYFTAIAEKALTGKNQMEEIVFENYLLPEKFQYIPEGMLPKNYPADEYEQVFIPNWAMWFVLELEDYLRREGKKSIVVEFKERIYCLLKYFESFENEYGLLEKLDGWVFVEWSKANELVQDVNFPTNMLYAKCLRAAGNMYEDTRLLSKAGKLEEVIRKMSFDGKFFCDNAMREDGKLVLTMEKTEVCQYYAFFMGIATPEKYKRLWDILVEDFGFQRLDTKKYNYVHHANAFIGYYLRMQLLFENGLTENLLNEIKGYFLHMAYETGTLWEHDSTIASCCHGFASILAYWIMDTLEKEQKEEELD